MKYKLKQAVIMLMVVVIAVSGLTVYREEAYAADAFETSLSKFPSSYRSYLRKLHEKYPNWKFEPLNTGLDWNTVVSAQTDPLKAGSGNRSLVASAGGDLLKRNEACDYNVSTGKYIYKDSTSWVSANSNTISFFLDPRNFLNEVDVFQFEKNSYDKSVHTLNGVKKILDGTFMDYSKGDFSYINTKGTKVKAKTTYAEEIFNAGKKYGVSPYYLAAKIRQEVGNYSGSVSGSYTSKDGKSKFVGYYNFYNIGANDGADPIKNGLNYAKKSDSSTLRPWNTPMKSIAGGTVFFYNNYIKSYQNTGYLVKFNVDKRSVYPIYTHQFMTNISGAASEAASTYKAYKDIGDLKGAKVFLIPVYKNMPSMSNKITITSATGKTATANGGLNVRSGPGTSYSTIHTLKNNEKVTIVEGQRTNTGYSYQNLLYPYWYKIKFVKNGKETTGYVYSEYLNMQTKKTIASGQTYQIPTSRTKTKDKVYYLSGNPAVATVDENGKVTARKKGKVTIYTFLGSGKMDSITINVEGMSLSHSEKTLNINSSFTLKATVSAENKTVSWSSNNAKAATVDQKGKVTAKGVGKATITAKSSSGVKKTCVVTVLPAKPYVNVSSYSYNYIHLKWNRSTYADGYQIYRATTGKYKKIATITKNKTKIYKDKTVVSGKTYKYRIRAYKKTGGVTYYTKYTYATCVARPKPGKITSSKVTKGKKSVNIRWHKYAGSSAYVLYRREEGVKKYTRIATIKGNKTFLYKDKQIKKGKTYFYRMRIYKVVNKKKLYGSYGKTVKVIVKK